MRAGSALPLTVESPAGRADLLVDGSRPLAELLEPLAAATGAPPGLAWTVQEGHRLLVLGLSLAEQSVCAGSELHLRRL